MVLGSLHLIGLALLLSKCSGLVSLHLLVCCATERKGRVSRAGKECAEWGKECEVTTDA